MHNTIREAVADARAALALLEQEAAIHFLTQGAQRIAECFRNGNKILIAGNGGSLCDAAHFAEELTGQFRALRKALPALALSEPGHMSCVGNDMGFEFIFSRALEAHGKPGDIFVGLTTSGNSPNIVQAFATARTLGMQTLAFLGKEGGKLRGVADLEFIVPGFGASDRIQEVHMTAIHILIQLVEELLFGTQELGSMEEVALHAALSHLKQ